MKLISPQPNFIVWLNQFGQKRLTETFEDLSEAAEIAWADFDPIPPSEAQWREWDQLELDSRDLLTATRSRIASTVVDLKLDSTNVPSTSSIKNPERTLTLTGNENWLYAAITSIRTLTDDRWFSSLWTLQEAFLCQSAYLISSEVEELDLDSPHLEKLFKSCSKLNSICKTSIALKRATGQELAPTETELKDIVEQSGVAALAERNAMVLYTIASNRVTSRPEDQIYGIMQVFRFRLGVSSPHANAAAQFTFADLELQFGQRLITQYPIMSQMHVHTVPTEPGQGWRISSSSRVPELATKVPFQGTDSFAGEHMMLCELSYETIDGICSGLFSGRMCAFHELSRAWKVAGDCMANGRREEAKGGSIHQIALDSSALIPQGQITDSADQDLPRDERQYKLAAEMASHFQHQTVCVLLLGRFNGIPHWHEFCKEYFQCGGDFQIGLILLLQPGLEKSKMKVWRRLGICIWDLVHPLDGASEKSLLDGTSAEWKHCQGLFG